jgi:uncharacterized membrane protein YphA (DoxX/SURF4 family)
MRGDLDGFVPDAKHRTRRRLRRRDAERPRRLLSRGHGFPLYQGQEVRPMKDLSEQRVVDTAWWTLRISFGLVPLLAGLDKFLNLLVFWPKYIAPAFAHLIPMSGQGFMYVVGIIEIVAGLGVLLSPWTKQFAYVVAAWLVCIAINLIAGRFFDIAVRDLVMAVSAVTLARLTDVVEVPATAARRRRLHPADMPA